MSTAAEYRARAAEAEMIARRMSRRDHKEAALQLAKDWTRRADVLERQEHAVGGGTIDVTDSAVGEGGVVRRRAPMVKAGS